MTAGLLVPAVCSYGKAAETEPGLHAMIGQMLLVGFRGDSLDGMAAGDAGGVKASRPDTLEPAIVRDIRRYNLGGVILFDYDVALKRPDRNIRSREQVRSLVQNLQRMAQTPLFVAVDQEGGRVARLKPAQGFIATPSAAALGNGTLAGTRTAGETVGRMLADVGINWDFAPVLDVNVNPDCPVIGRLGRSFSGDPGQVAEHGRAFAEGLNAYGVIACFKHFPGHGSARADSHMGVTDVTATWSARELVPYRRLLGLPLTTAVMTGHLFNARLDAEHPATLSRKTITGLLRESMGYEGVIITDDLQMRAVADAYGLETTVELALKAGADILLFGNNLSYDPDIVPKVVRIITRLVETRRITPQRIAQSYRRIRTLKKSLN